MSDKAINDIIATNLNRLLEVNGKSQADLAAYMEVSQATVSNWCKAIKVPRMDKLDRICIFFNCSRSDLMDERVEKPKGVKIPVLGDVAAGIPIEAVEEILDYEEIDEDLAKKGEFFGLRIKGNSMAPRIQSGDVVIVRVQPYAESGDIVIAKVNGDDACCKKLLKHNDGITLLSFNPDYEPLSFNKNDVISLPVSIIGKVVELRGKF
ncbi:MAG: LexA family protein [Granulicatella sp.]